MTSWSEEFRRSIKAAEAEDRVDLHFYRPAGFLIAKLAMAFRLTPTQLTLAGMVAGIAAGACFSRGAWGAGAFLFLFSGVLDSADGQLARLSGRSTPFGMILDGLCDNAVFVAVYLGCLLPRLPACGPWLWPVAIVAGLSHSLQSATFDFYLREYLYYSKGSPEVYRNPGPAEATALARRQTGIVPRALAYLRLSWVRQQALFSTRGPELRAAFRAAAAQNERLFSVRYRRTQLRALRAWQLLGANAHTLGILLFAYLSRFELYLMLVDLTALNAWLLLAYRWQRLADENLRSRLVAAERAAGVWPAALTGREFQLQPIEVPQFRQR